jgi:hypothetical protein
MLVERCSWIAGEVSVRCREEDLRVDLRDARPSALAEAPTAEELAERALHRLVRGGTWEALANEIAWKAMKSAGAEPSCLEWLPGLVEATLSERVDRLEFLLEGERRSARVEHLREWPHDLAGAETAATLAADEEGRHQVGRLYLDVLEWTSGLLRDRLTQGSRSGRSRLLALRRAQSPPEPEVPELVADSLTQTSPRYGWPSRSEAA